jgi:hypothetical protein
LVLTLLFTLLPIIVGDYILIISPFLFLTLITFLIGIQKLKFIW